MRNNRCCQPVGNERRRWPRGAWDLALGVRAALVFGAFSGVLSIAWSTAEGAGPADGWCMVAANPQRTSQVTDGVAGHLRPEWYRRFEPYISQKVQVIAADGLVFVATARGLYTFDADTGQDRWVYATAMPLGHSPTVSGGVVYVGGFDRRLHAIDAATGKGLWTGGGDAGFQTNPLVVDGLAIAGSRDGALYALDAGSGALRWKYQTDGPLLFSPAYHDGVVYFASNDNHAYAVEAATGRLRWKSSKLPGAGFHSWWPVVHQDRLILAGSENYSNDPSLTGDRQFLQSFRTELFPGDMAGYKGVGAGPSVADAGEWSHGRTVFDLSKSHQGTLPVTEYLERKPWRRTYFVLDRRTGKEITYDFDGDGKPEYAPLVHCGTQTGNRYPPVVGPDGMLYQFAACRHSGGPIPRGGIVGWRMDTPFISLVNDFAVDEPLAYAVGGSLLYSALCVNRVVQADELLGPLHAKVRYFNYDLETLLPDAFSEYSLPPGRTYGGRNGVYGLHGDQNPPIPYRGKVYIHRANYLIAFSAQGGGRRLPDAVAVAAQPQPPAFSREELRRRLDGEIEKILAAGHLRPGYQSAGFFDRVGWRAGYEFGHYFSDPSVTIIVLTRALPHVSDRLREPLSAYVRNEFETYPPYRYSHVGWKDGAHREAFDTPPEVQTLMEQTGPASRLGASGSNFPRLANYALFRYAQLFGDAPSLWAYVQPVEAVPPDDFLRQQPYVHNACIASLAGLCGLARMAGEPEPVEAQAQLRRLLSLRADSFSPGVREDGPATRGPARYESALGIARNFMFLTPELSEYLRAHAREKVSQALEDCERLAPYWFVAKAEEGYGESAIVPLWHYHAVFQAKALILQEPYSTLERYLDVPAFAVGDLFYVDNLISALDSPK